MRIIAVCTVERVAFGPDLPTLAEAGMPDHAMRSWMVLLAPRGTAPYIVQAMSTASREALETSQMRGRLRDLGSEPIWMHAATTERFVREEYARWALIVRAAGVKIE